MRVRVATWSTLPEADKRRILTRSETDISNVLAAAREVIDQVRAGGDQALAACTKRFDGADIAGLPLAVTEQEFAEAEASLDTPVKKAIRFCAANVRRFHERQLPAPLALEEVLPGVLAGDRATPISSAGLYVPRGKGSFPSSTYMLAVPASVAGVPRVVAVTPPDRAGRCDPATLYAARLCGVHEVYRVGGVQAIAALALGTESIQPVEKLMGPGSLFVSAAKRLLADVVDVGLPAGPSESMILADESADPRLLALDLLIEAEHGPDSQALLVTTSESTARAVARLLPVLAGELPEPRRGFVEKVLEGYGGILIAQDAQEAAAIADAVAPEHLQVATRDPKATLARLHNAGEILLGQGTPFSRANYAIGANAVLPTGGRARTASALSVRDFLKYSSVASLTPGGFDALKDAAITLADYEGFPAHAKALRERSPDVTHKVQKG